MYFHNNILITQEIISFIKGYFYTASKLKCPLSYSYPSFSLIDPDCFATNIVCLFLIKRYNDVRLLAGSTSIYVAHNR